VAIAQSELNHLMLLDSVLVDSVDQPVLQAVLSFPEAFVGICTRKFAYRMKCGLIGACFVSK
jgi:hypothetical protein